MAILTFEQMGMRMRSPADGRELDYTTRCAIVSSLSISLCWVS
ncbi:hypothetical protein [Coleofasciculus sp. FACHB-T130]|nr:hypothetical protein [Coleofasciculus sp. FACHB-T130]